MKIIQKSLMILGLLFSTLVQAQSLTEQQWAVQLSNGQSSIPLAQYKGKVLWIDFWASWCAPCRASFPWMNTMQEKYGDYGFKVVAINVDENSADAVQFLRQHPASFSVFFDPNGQAPALFNVQGMPTSILVDRKGNIHFIHIGFEPSQKAALEDKIQSVISGR